MQYDPNASLPPLAPPPLDFNLKDAVSGAAYPLFVRALAVLIVLSLGIWFGVLYRAEQIVLGKGMLWLVAGYALLLITVFYILRSRTTMSSQMIEQTWMWSRKTNIADLAYVKLYQVPGLTWLFAPRFYTRTYSGKMAAYYVADPAVREQCAKLVVAVQSLKQNLG